MRLLQWLLYLDYIGYRFKVQHFEIEGGEHYYDAR